MRLIREFEGEKNIYEINDKEDFIDAIKDINRFFLPNDYDGYMRGYYDSNEFDRIIPMILCFQSRYSMYLLNEKQYNFTELKQERIKTLPTIENIFRLLDEIIKKDDFNIMIESIEQFNEMFKQCEIDMAFNIE